LERYSAISSARPLPFICFCHTWCMLYACQCVSVWYRILMVVCCEQVRMVVQAEQETLRVYERQSRVSGGTPLSACSLLDTATTASRLMIPDNTPGGRGDCDRMMHDIREKFNKLRVSSTLCVMFTYLKTSFMLSGLVYIWLAMCLRSPQTASISLSVRPPCGGCGLRAEAGDCREIFVRIHAHRSLYDLL